MFQCQCSAAHSRACCTACTGLPDPLSAPTKAWANSSRIWPVNWFVATGQRVPCEQLPQRGIVAARHRGDQLISSIASLLPSGGNKFTNAGNYGNIRCCIRAFDQEQTSMSDHYDLPRRARPAGASPLTMPSAVTETARALGTQPTW
jgi:hypothetical protein